MQSLYSAVDFSWRPLKDSEIYERSCRIYKHQYMGMYDGISSNIGTHVIHKIMRDACERDTRSKLSKSSGKREQGVCDVAVKRWLRVCLALTIFAETANSQISVSVRELFDATRTIERATYGMQCARYSCVMMATRGYCGTFQTRSIGLVAFPRVYYLFRIAVYIHTI